MKEKDVRVKTATYMTKGSGNSSNYGCYINKEIMITYYSFYYESETPCSIL
jgi:hypothetical protein